MSKSDVIEIIVCQKDQLSKIFTCERMIISNGDLVLINAEEDDGNGTVWDSVHFPMSTIDSYYVRTIA